MDSINFPEDSIEFAMNPITITCLSDLNRVYRLFFLLLLDYSSNDLKLSLLITAFLLWLQVENNDQFIIPKLLYALNPVDTELVVRKVINYLNYLASDSYENRFSRHAPNSSSYLGLTATIESLYRRKYSAISGIKRYLRTTCTRLFSDILQSKLRFDRSFQPLPCKIISIPGSSDTVFGAICFQIWPRIHLFNTDDEFSLWMHAQTYVEDNEDRSLYVTFSGHYSVTKEELEELFTSEFGDCVQFVDMNNDKRRIKKILFARVVVKSAEMVDVVLKGQIVAKFKIKRKDVWVKKYKRRNR